MPTGVSEFGSIYIQIDGKKIDTFKEYQFGSHFLAPTDAFSFKLGDETTDAKILDLCKPGKVVTLLINDKVQCTGYIDKVEIAAGRRGTEMSISGRDRLSPVVDSMLHPKTTFANTTLLALLTQILGDFGFLQFDVSNEININKVTGRQQGRKKPPKKLNEYPVPHGKPHQGEGTFAFLSRISQRYGLWIWSSADGTTAICSKPDMAQQPRYSLTHKIGGAKNNIEESHVCFDSTDQPTYLIAKGNIPPTEFERANAVVGLVNPIFNGVPNSPPPATYTKVAVNAFNTFLKGNPDTTTVTVEAPPVQLFNQFASLIARPVWLKDDESRTQEQLQKFALREMSLRTRKAFTYTATVMSHEIAGQPINVDTIVSVDDDRCNVHGPLYVLGVTHRKSRAGTFSDLECIWPGTISF